MYIYRYIYFTRYIGFFVIIVGQNIKYYLVYQDNIAEIRENKNKKSSHKSLRLLKQINFKHYSTKMRKWNTHIPTADIEQHTSFLSFLSCQSIHPFFLFHFKYRDRKNLLDIPPH